MKTTASAARVVVTDKLRSYGAAHHEVMPAGRPRPLQRPTRHLPGRWCPATDSHCQPWDLLISRVWAGGGPRRRVRRRLRVRSGG
jgi:hypothetical protein